MSFTRRRFLKTTTAAAAGVAGSQLLGSRWARSQDTMSFEPEEGAELRVLRWSRFVQGDEELWMANTAKFTEQTGIPVRIDNESWEDVRPKAAVA
ncbi:MAG: twin-arginine translocation signal domain-containing protein, partial [Gemmatimonadetes bacterium]|nr:twin-arginine translocation signal domain-containing protein [Gemmatimonadota bacterium]NIT68758.1 twin-arginine translocation signal domain-containing protein [Gemmatimonadota bacterium]NIW74384.1 twin-arginine translocation signal domain-containing protein [Gemmatimonadota bacterium]NIY37335.1 twin-arginine translocation signal domain-containing protein [Gemmatimonadota bacterium]